MAEVCVFCGVELTLLGKNVLECGGVTQPVCKACRKEYAAMSQIERCRELLRTGRAVEAEKVRAFFEEKERETAKQREKMAAMQCCGQPMTYLGVSEFQLGCQGWFLGNLPNLVAGSMGLAVFQCERCGQVKFMNPKFLE